MPALSFSDNFISDMLDKILNKKKLQTIRPYTEVYECGICGKKYRYLANKCRGVIHKYGETMFNPKKHITKNPEYGKNIKLSDIDFEGVYNFGGLAWHLHKEHGFGLYNGSLCGADNKVIPTTNIEVGDLVTWYWKQGARKNCENCLHAEGGGCIYWRTKEIDKCIAKKHNKPKPIYCSAYSNKFGVYKCVESFLIEMKKEDAPLIPNYNILKVPENIWLMDFEIEALAIRDCFKSADDMFQAFEKAYGMDFTGQVMRFKKIK